MTSKLFPLAAAGLGAAGGAAGYFANGDAPLALALGFGGFAAAMALRNWWIAEEERPLLAEELLGLHDTVDVLKEDSAELRELLTDLASIVEQGFSNRDGAPMAPDEALGATVEKLAQRLEDQEARAEKLATALSLAVSEQRRKDAAASETAVAAPAPAPEEPAEAEEPITTQPLADEPAAHAQSPTAPESAPKLTADETGDPAPDAPNAAVFDLGQTPVQTNGATASSERSATDAADRADGDLMREPTIAPAKPMDLGDAASRLLNRPTAAEPAAAAQRVVQAPPIKAVNPPKEPAPIAAGAESEWSAASMPPMAMAGPARAGALYAGAVHAGGAHGVSAGGGRAQSAQALAATVPAPAADGWPEPAPSAAQRPPAPTNGSSRQAFAQAPAARSALDDDARSADRQAPPERFARALAAAEYDVQLLPALELPGRKPRFFELTASRRANGSPADLLTDSAATVALGARVAQKLRRADAGLAVFCNLPAAALWDAAFARDLVAYADADGDANGLVFEFAQKDLGAIDPPVLATLERLAAIGAPMALDAIHDWSVDIDRLARLGFRYLKLDSAEFLDRVRAAGGSAQRLLSAFERIGLELVVEKIDGEDELQEVLAAGARYGQGPALAPARRVRVD